MKNYSLPTCFTVASTEQVRAPPHLAAALVRLKTLLPENLPHGLTTNVKVIGR